MPTLPANLTLDPAQRAEIQRYVAGVDTLLKQTPIDSDEWEVATLVVVTKLMLALPSSQQNEAGAEAVGEAYQAALDDVPTWAVVAAARRWYRGECGCNERGQPYDCHWRPAPAELRSIACTEMWRIKLHINTLRKLLDAVPRVEFSEEHCARMRERFSEIRPSMRLA